MKTAKSIIWGIVLIILGIILGGNALELFSIDIFFDGWWTLFIIIPSIFGVCTDDDKKGSVITLIIGILLLLACQSVIDFELIWKLLLPIIIIVIGLSLVIRNSINKDTNEEIEKLNGKMDRNEGYAATFSGQEIKLDNQEFKGTNLNAVFGGLTIDLRNSIIKKDAVINATCIFGGIDILVPDDVVIKTKTTSVFGGIENKKNLKDNKEAKTIYINATCIFGGVDIK